MALADRYRIERELGQGGMATVYLAHDVKHDRKVAVKVLKPELAAVLGAERFVVEIRTTASLQHPHILPLFDSGSADGFLYYVMPFIEGETLREKLNRETQLSVDEAVRITRDVADALDYAHRRGVIHRDIKPENILLHDGRPVVADFGIALAVSAAAGGRMTETGLSLGTPHYMSPEQATADKEITGRSDIYSLASVLYEMLAGQPPHLGGSAQQIIMKIIAEPVDAVTRYRKSVPPNVAAALARALEKLPADRFDNARAFADALGNVGFSYASAAPVETIMPAPRQRATARRGAIMGLAALALLATGLAAWGWMRPEIEVPVARFDLSTGDVLPVALSDIVISSDGQTIAMAGRLGSVQGIFVRRLDGETTFRMVSGTEGGSLPSFSPDGRWIAFKRNSDDALLKVPVVGGGAVTIVPASDSSSPWYSEWFSNDSLTYTGLTGVYRVSANGGPPQALPNARAQTVFTLPDGSGLLFSSPRGVSFYDMQKRDSATLLIPNASQGTYLDTGHLLYVSADRGLFAVPFDLKTHRISGTPIRVVDRIASGPLARGYSISRNGLIILRGATGASAGAETRFVIMDIDGKADTLRLPKARRLLPRFSPNGKALVYEQMRGMTPATDIHTFDLVTGATQQLTFDGDNDEPIWSADGRLIAFARAVASSNEDLHVKPADNSGQEQSVLSAPGNQNPTQWLPDGTLLFVHQTADGATSDLLMLRMDGDAKPIPYLAAPWNEDDIQVSPDGKLAAFMSTEDGESAIWIRDFPTPRGKWRVSPGFNPRWSTDGHVYFWKRGLPKDSLLRVKVERTPSVVVRSPEVITTLAAAGVANWDLHPDGRRFIVTIDDLPGAGNESGPAYQVVLNWFKEFKRVAARVTP